MNITMSYSQIAGLVIFSLCFGFALGGHRPVWERCALAAVFLAFGFAYNALDSRMQATKEEFYAKHMTLPELNAFACGVIKARGETALTGGCDKFKDMQP